MVNKRLSVLKNRSDFRYILKKGQRVRPSDWVILNYIVRDDEKMRCGWTLPRQVGSAVVRNRLKRWTRVFLRAKVKSGEVLPVDINFVFRKTEGDFYKKLSYEQFSEVLSKGWQHLEKRIKNPTSVGRQHVQGRRGSSPRGSLPV